MEGSVEYELKSPAIPSDFLVYSLSTATNGDSA
jgi:hypothetical protein